MSTFTSAADIPDHETIRLVGWGTLSDLATSIRPRLFGLMVERAMAVVKEFHGDLFQDALSLESMISEANLEGGAIRFRYLIRHSGTTLGAFATYMASTHYYDFVLFDVVVHHDERMEWSATFDVVSRGATRVSTEDVQAAMGGVTKPAPGFRWTLDNETGEFDTEPVESVPPAPDATNQVEVPLKRGEGVPDPKPETWWDFETEAAPSDCQFWNLEGQGTTWDCAGPRVGVERRVNSKGVSLMNVTGRTRCEKHVNNPPEETD